MFTRTLEDGMYDDKLVTFVLRLTYDFYTGTGEIFFPEGNCCDARGAIERFTSIDPKVREIRTFSGDQRDTTYLLSDGKWGGIPAISSLQENRIG